MLPLVLICYIIGIFVMILLGAFGGFIIDISPYGSWMLDTLLAFGIVNIKLVDIGALLGFCTSIITLPIVSTLSNKM